MKQSIVILIVILAGALLVFVLSRTSSKVSTTNEIVDNSAIKNNNPETDKNMEITRAILNTNKGNIEIEFFEKDAPKTVANFIQLANDGFYNNIKFHRVISGFMIQTGDPLTKDDSKQAYWGTGGPGYKFPDEINPKSDLYTKTGYKKGIVAMANSGPNTNGSQFFIMHVDYPLPPLYTIFGKVVAGQSVVDSIAATPTDSTDRPLSPVVIKSVTLK